MEKQSRRKFSADFKAKVVIEALRERETIEAIAHKYELHPNQISAWKKEFLENAEAAFQSGSDASDEKKKLEAQQEQLYSQIGKLKVENEWLKKKWQALQ
jgi:transposase